MICFLFCFINIFVIITNVSNAINLQSPPIQNNVNGDNVQRDVNPFSSVSGDKGIEMSSVTQLVPDLSPDGIPWRDMVHIEDNYIPPSFSTEVSSQIGFVSAY